MSKLSIVSVGALSMLFGLDCTAYDSQAHRDVNFISLYQLPHMGNGIDLDRILRNGGWAPLGLDTALGANSIAESIWTIGGPGEDDPVWRVVNHFMEYGTYSGLFGDLFYSADKWASEACDGKPPGGAPNQGLVTWGGDYSWDAAMDRYLVGLTGYGWVPDGLGRLKWTRLAATAAEREEHLAYAFRSLGQVMHLVADMSVPSHVRNDQHHLRIPAWQTAGPFRLALNHLAKDGYEAWASTNASAFQAAASGAARVVTPDDLSFQLDDQWFRANLCNYFSTGARFNEVVAGTRPPGLVDFTALNFVSQDTIFSRRYGYPRNDQTRLTRLRPGSPYWSYRISTGVTVPHYVRDNFVGPALSALGARVPATNAVMLDDTCYQDHAQILAPEAVRYAAGVLRNFFAYEVVAGVTARGGATVVEYRIVRAGSRTAQNPEGELADMPSSTAYVIGLSGPQEEATYLGSLFTDEGAAGQIALTAVAGCYDRIRVVCQGSETRVPWTGAATIQAQLHVSAHAGQPLLAGLNLELVQPHGPACKKPSPVANLAPSGTISVAAVLDEAGTEMPLGDSAWPSWSAGLNASLSFRHYHVRFFGTLGGVLGVPLSAHYDEPRQEGFAPSQTAPAGWGTYPMVLTDGDEGTIAWDESADRFEYFDWWHRWSWNYAATNQAHDWSVVQTVENGVLRSTYADFVDADLYTGSTWPDCREDEALWHWGPSLGDAAHPPVITAASVVEVDVKAAVPAEGHVSVRLSLRGRQGAADASARVMLPANRRRAAPIGDQYPELFGGGQTYTLDRSVGLGFHGCETKLEEVPPGSGTFLPVQYNRDISVRAVRVFP